MKKLLLLFWLPLFSGCAYSFTGVNVGEAKTVSVEFFPNNAELVQPQLSQIFTDALRDIFVRQTSLNLVENEGDLHLEGAIMAYKIEPINVQASELGTVAQNRMTVVVNVIFTNAMEPKNNFEQSFSRYADFDAEVDLAQVEVELLSQISEELSENIMNKAIGNW